MMAGWNGITMSLILAIKMFPGYHDGMRYSVNPHKFLCSTRNGLGRTVANCPCMQIWWLPPAGNLYGIGGIVGFWGSLPGGGGSKEMTLRASGLLFRKNLWELNCSTKELLLTNWMAKKYLLPAYEAFDMGVLEKGKDSRG